MFDHVDARFDTGPHDVESPPARPYVLCATPRSGSNLLCDGLIRTGLVGTPLEYFNTRYRRALERRWGCDGSPASYLRSLYGRRTTAAGYLGVKIQWDQLVPLRAEVLETDDREPEFAMSLDFLERLLPGAKFLRIIREDVNRQAVSLWLALQTNVWTEPEVSGDGSPPAATRAFYSFEGIERCRRVLENSELHWDRCLRANGIEPHVVVYERLVEDREATIREAVRWLRPDADTIDVHPPGIRRRSAELTEQMVERFALDREKRPLPNPLELVGEGGARPTEG
jgi:LPS sulfotransferase NodH